MLPLIFNSFKKSSKNDYELLEIWEKFFNGLYTLKTKSKEEYLIEANRAEWPEKYISVIKNSSQNAPIKILMSRGAQFVIYTDNNNIGIIINDSVPRVVAVELGRMLPDWFVHPSGFLVAWGTKKAIKPCKPKETVKDLINYIKDIYE